MGRSKMTKAERKVWHAAYAAAFVREFVDEELGVTSGTPATFDDAAERISAERSIRIADLAVLRLREYMVWQRTDAGVQIDTAHAHKETRED